MICGGPRRNLVKDWEARTPLGVFARVRDRVMSGQPGSSAVTWWKSWTEKQADVVVIDTLIPSALSGAEAAGVPSALLMHGPYLLPRAGAPLIGLGFLPARGSLGRLRDRAAWSLTMALFRTGMPALNQARAEFGLAPLHHLAELAATAGRILVCTSPSYDFAADAVPGNVRYVGPQLDNAGGGAWDDPWAAPKVARWSWSA